MRRLLASKTRRGVRPPDALDPKKQARGPAANLEDDASGTMKGMRTNWITGVLTIGAALIVPALSANAEMSSAPMPHIVLDSSAPADESATTDPVTEIRLFFSGAPLMRGASVRVITSARQLMRTSPPAADATDPKQLFVQIDPPLPPGAYRVQWRCIADDGHVMRGDFSFEISAE